MAAYLEDFGFSLVASSKWKKSVQVEDEQITNAQVRSLGEQESR